MTWVKICGMTNLEDALLAVDAGADAVGFVFYEKSPRCVSVETAREIVEKLPKEVEKVGVFAAESMEHAIETAHYAGFDSLQTYPLTGPRFDADDKSQAKARGLNGLGMYWALPMAIFLGDDSKNVAGFVPQEPRPDLSWLISPAGPQPEFIHTLVLDSGGPNQPGGTGRAYDWNEAAGSVKKLSRHQKVVIAGGLTPQNVGEAMEILRPWGVDVVSGVEARPGKKDAEKVRAFVLAVREMDGKVS
jgi:phosphoribosylanthranilate isomerase